ncbi:Protein NUCLEAR FUSION DEFECTIVE 4 [Dichanthelium oligosanthes]|uniref:Protein NUCLEAR FUSION DEFECTIVE 4 n=1 Tax=Dichanthelium oligosanthes TaxID=888268 RepID=A0A1E5WCC0_9POAL|nr:Protein NUCLEAR FUSION DEFECTIVE 4 [Dichanthelium oligosanthes]
MPSSPSSAHWLSLVGSIWLQTINGPNADFPVYSSQLKDLKHISQVQLNFLAFASDAGKLFGWFSGVAALYLPLWLVAFVGAAFGLVGYGVQYLFLDSAGLQYWHLFLLTSLAGNGICWINTVCYLLCIRNFGSSSRVAVSLAASYLGLSAKVYTSLADSIPGLADSKAKAYLLLNAVVPMLVTVVVAPSLRVVDLTTGGSTDAAFLVMFAITLATGACAVVGSIGSTSNGLSSREHMVSLGVLLATPILIPLALRIRESLNKIRETKRENRIHDLGTDAIDAIERVVAIDIADVESKEGDDSAAEKPREEVGGLRLLRKLDFWLYFFSYMFSGTLGLVFLNNLGQIAESRRLAQTSTLVSLSSSFGFFGRLLPSFLDYYSAKSGYSISRTGSMASLMAPMAGAFFLLLKPSDLFLYLSTAVIGTCTGAITSVAVSATRELFGTENFGVNHNVVVTNIPVGSLCFGYFAAYLYQRGARGSHRCIGAACYQQTFVAWGAACAVGTLLCAALYARSRSFAGRLPPAPAPGGAVVRTSSCLARLANLVCRW